MTTQTQTIQNKLSTVHPAIVRFLNKRNIQSNEELSEYFSWDLHKLPKLTDMLDMDVCCERIIQAIENNEKIGIYGDYDVDGTTSCALFYHFFQMIGVKVETMQPSRFVEGYGIHPVSIDQAIEKEIDLLITVDCGITNVETAKYTHDKNIDLIITDHHTDAAEIIPPCCAVVNPNRRDEPKDSPLKVLAGVGVAFAVCLRIKEILEKKGQTVPSIYSLLQFVAIGTICDLAKMTSLNMKLTRHGLKQIPKTEYEGLIVFFTPEEREVPMIHSEKMGFYIGPLINSKGRLDHPEQALNCLIASDHASAFEAFSHLEISNRERKVITAEVFNQAKKEVIKNISDDNMLVSIPYSPEYHEGVIGIVASRLVDTFEVPAIVFTDSEKKGIIKASARSAGELDLFELLNSCKDLYEKFGGHKAAAGLSMKKENLDEFRTRINNALSEIPPVARTIQDHYDVYLEFNEINHKLLKDLELCEPFSMGNERPMFRMTNVQIESFKILKDVHVKWTFINPDNPRIKLNGISFNYIGKWGTKSPEELFANQKADPITVQFNLGINRYRGNEYIQLMVDKIF